MHRDWQAGDYVDHPAFGLGKILNADASRLRIYFKNADEPDPDKRVRTFAVPSQFLLPTSATSDVELDNLPPWKDDRFDRRQTAHSWEKAKTAFARRFPQGLSDPKFIAEETLYKRSAHARFSEIRTQLESAIADTDGLIVASLIEEIYGSTKAPRDSADARLNVLFQQVEEPAYFSALRAGGDATVEYAIAALAFIDTPTAESFIRYAQGLAALPPRRDGKTVDSWTAATWFPFIANPLKHFLIKPTIVQAFESLLPFDIRYRAELNFDTYARTVEMSRRIRQMLEDSELNLGYRALDAIDVQSFMWVVERYAEG